MEYMENTFKVRKEKCDTILHKAKEPKGETYYILGQIWAKHMEKKGPNPNQTIFK
jgi:hypothetical protein